MNNNTSRSKLGLSEDEISDLTHFFAHEFGNPLTSIITLASFLEQILSIPNKQTDISELKKHLGTISKEAWRLNFYHQRFTALFSTRDNSQDCSNPKEVCLKVINHLEKFFGFNSEYLYLNFSENLNSFPLDERTLQLVISELLFNCKDEKLCTDSNDFPIRLSLSNTELSISSLNNKQSHLPAELSSKPSQNKSSKFQSGLSICKKMVESKGGRIEITEKESGSSFIFSTKVYFN